MPLEAEPAGNLYTHRHTFDVPSGETRRPPGPAQNVTQSVYPQNDGKASHFKGSAGLFPGGWKVDHPGPDMATEQLTPPSNHTPTGLTPSESQNSSSATSYSPHQEEARNTTQNDQTTESPNVFSFPDSRQGVNSIHRTTTSSLDDRSNSSYHMPRTPLSNGESFTIPPGWDFGTGATPMPTGSTPVPSDTTPFPTGLSPPADGDWSQLLGTMGWGASGPETANYNWPEGAGAVTSPKYAYKSGFLYDAEDNPNGNEMAK